MRSIPYSLLYVLIFLGQDKEKETFSPAWGIVVGFVCSPPIKKNHL